MAIHLSGDYHLVADVAREFDITTSSVLHWIRAGKLEAVKLGKSNYLVPDEAFRAIKAVRDAA